MFVAYLQIEPYVMVKPDDDSDNATSGPVRQQFVGYIPDLLHELSYIIQFDYDIRPVHDASFGHRRLDGTWDGMVGQLIDGVSRSVSRRESPRSTAAPCTRPTRRRRKEYCC